MMSLIDLADRAILPDPLIRSGIRLLDHKRLLQEKRPTNSLQDEAKQAFVKVL